MLISCRVCQVFSDRGLAELNDTLRQGSPSDLNNSVQFYLPKEDLEYHMVNCLGLPLLLEGEVEPPPVTTPYQKRLNELEDLVEKLKTAKSAYGGGDPEAGDTYAKLLKEFRGFIVDIENAKDPQVLIQSIAEQVLTPLVKSIISTLTEELVRLREQTTAIDPDHGKQHDRNIKEALTRLAPKIADLLDNAVSDLDGTVDNGKSQVAKKSKEWARDLSVH